MSDNADSQKARVRASFDAAAEEYDRGPGCFAHFGRRLVELTGVGPNDRVLDVATGRGAVLFPAAERIGQAGQVFGVDLSPEMVAATNAEVARRGIHASAQVMDAENLDFPEESFDRVLCGFGLMFFPNQLAALRGFRRVLRNRGQIGVSTWQRSQAADLQAVVKQLGLGEPPPSGWIDDPAALRRLLDDAGFVDVQTVADQATFVYEDLDEYWHTARGTGLRRMIDNLDAEQTARVRVALADALRQYEREDGLHVPAIALIGLARR